MFSGSRLDKYLLLISLCTAVTDYPNTGLKQSCRIPTDAHTNHRLCNNALHSLILNNQCCKLTTVSTAQFDNPLMRPDNAHNNQFMSN